MAKIDLNTPMMILPFKFVIIHFEIKSLRPSFNESLNYTS